jgi:hypothetical protein
VSARVFTPYEATRTLPLVRSIVIDVLARGRELRALAAQGERSDEDDRRVDVLADELEALFSELEQLGCTFRSPDFSFGLVDFPGLIDGQLVHLCWRDDEPSLGWYHAPHAGFAGRKPIPAELLLAPSGPLPSTST